MNDSSSVKQGPDYVAGRVGNSERFERTQGTTLDAGAQRSASRPYWQADAREILRVAGFGSNYGDLGIAAEQCEYGAHFIVIDETGVSPNASLEETPSLLWKPCLELLDGPDPPDARVTPGLRFPFDAPQLAMFMLDGPGAYVTIAFGEWQIEPDQERLDSMHIYANRAREAVQGAFAAYHQAVGVVGQGYLEPEAEEAEANRRYNAAYEAACVKHNVDRKSPSRDQYWIQLELAKNEVAPLRDQQGLARERSASARSLWRKAMVKELTRLSALQTVARSQGEVVAIASASGGVMSLPVSEPRNAATGPIFKVKTGDLLQRLSFEEAALELSCNPSAVRRLVVEEKRLKAVLVTLVGHAQPYDLQLIDVGDTGAAFDLSSGFENPPRIGYLRIERAVLDDFFPQTTARSLNSPNSDVSPTAVTEPPAPVVAETVAHRRARYLALFEAEEKREKRGALQRVADSEGVDRSNMSKDLKKARDGRDAQKRAGGGWTSQLVQDGKRTG